MLPLQLIFIDVQIFLICVSQMFSSKRKISRIIHKIADNNFYEKNIIFFLLVLFLISCSENAKIKNKFEIQKKIRKKISTQIKSLKPCYYKLSDLMKFDQNTLKGRNCFDSISAEQNSKKWRHILFF